MLQTFGKLKTQHKSILIYFHSSEGEKSKNEILYLRYKNLNATLNKIHSICHNQEKVWLEKMKEEIESKGHRQLGET